MSRFSGVLLLARAAASCGDSSEDRDAVVVSVGDREVTQAVLDRFIASQTGLGGALDAPLLSALLEEFVRERLLVIAAEEEGIEVSEVQVLEETSALRRAPGPEVVRTDDDTVAPESAGDEPEDGGGEPVDPEEDWLRSRVRDRLMVDRLMDTVVLAGLEATEEALQLEFEANRAFYARPETVTLSERRFDDRESAQAAAGRLRQESRSGEDAGAADPFLPVGTFRRGELPDAVDEAVFVLDSGDTTDAVETAAGFRVFRVDERLPAASLEFEEVQDVVRLTVLRQEADIRVQALLDDLQRRHPVRIHTANLAFPYVGSLAREE
ncbi:MAG: hypothetical protein F4X43_07035 [Acidobacteria bacterium]|nr:hypothetical protein [Acidobacteriota bacterium]